MSLEAEERREARLIEEALSGRREAFGELFVRHRERAYALAYHYTHNKEDALDVVQDAFIRAFQKLSRFERGRAFSPWLLTIVRNLAIDLLRRRRTRPLEEVPPGVARSQPAAERKVLSSELWRALQSLAPEQREIIFLKDYQGHSYREIATILGIPLGTVMSRLHYARRKLAQTFLGVRDAVPGD